MERAEAQKAIIAGLVLGVTAAVVVWFLERFNTERMAKELRAHLDQHSDELRQWMEGKLPRQGT